MSHSAVERSRFHLIPMRGRDPLDPHRGATPLELLFDLAFVVAFGVAGSEFAHLVAHGSLAPALGGFAFAMFAVCWAWINFTWFASAYDTDDWLHRLLTLVQMTGVVILALGLAPMFASLEHGEYLDNGIMVAGYVVMRVALVLQWLRAAWSDPGRRRTALTYAAFVLVAQVGWVALAVAHLHLAPTFAIAGALYLIELGGPVVAEVRGPRTPWHPHHIAERYGLLAIIALGEGVIGTVAAVNAVVASQGWSADAIAIVATGLAITFALWWIYFQFPTAQLLHEYPLRAFPWGYLHIIVFAAIAAVGAGLHVAALVIEHEAHIDQAAAIAAIAVPVGIFIVIVFVLQWMLARRVHGGDVVVILAALAILVAAIALAASGVGLVVCLAVVTAAPVVVTIVDEVLGRPRHAAAASHE
jgi:low temperature requirement protein LtrA